MLERRFLKTDLRYDGGAGTIEGFCCRYGVLSHMLGGFRERLTPGVFADSLRDGNADIFSTREHQNSMVIARQSNGSLQLFNEPMGLRFIMKPNVSTSVGKDCMEDVRAGLLKECSFSFACEPGGDSWSEEDDPEDSSLRCAVRTLNKANLFSIDLVLQPAYPQTSAGVRSMSELFPEGQIKVPFVAVNDELLDQIKASRLF